ncbi:uncharacterized protein PHA67_000298 [Liasis olivaceus]
MSSSGVWVLVALATLLLLGQPSQGNGQPRPYAAPSQRFGFWKRDDAVLYQATTLYHEALSYLGKEHNCTYHPAPGGKTDITVLNIHGQIYYFRTMVVKAKCPEEQKSVTLKNCEIVPGSPKYLCLLEVVTFPAFNIHNINIRGCKELPTDTSPPVSSAEEGNEKEEDYEKEEGIPYM